MDGCAGKLLCILYIKAVNFTIFTFCDRTIYRRLILDTLYYIIQYRIIDNKVPC